MNKKKYKAIACAVVLATSFAAGQHGNLACAEEEYEEEAAWEESYPEEEPAAEVYVEPYIEETAPVENAAAVDALTEASASTPAAVEEIPAATEQKPAEALSTGQGDLYDKWKSHRPDFNEIDNAVQQLAGKTVVAVEVVSSNESIKPMAESAVSMKPGTPFSVTTMNKDIYAINDSGYFSDIYPSFEIVPEGVVVTYNVLENPVVQSVEINGNSKIEPTDKLNKFITVKTGEILNQKELNKDIVEIIKQYTTDGYIFAKISNLDMDRKTGKLTITINEGTLEGYKVKGNTKTKERVILREMRTKVGEPINKKDVVRSQQRLTNLGFFEKVEIVPTPGVEPNAVVLEITVTEKRTGAFGIGAGYSSSDGVMGTVSLNESNFRGTGDSVGASYVFGGNDSDTRGYTFSYRHPWVDKKETAWQISCYNRSYDYDDYDTNGNEIEEYMRKYSGVELGFSRPVSEYSTNYLNLRNRFDNYIEHKSGLDRTNYTTWRDYNFGTTRSVTFAHVTDTRDNAFYPMKGSRVSLSGEFAGLGGDFNYQKYTIDDQHYKKVGHAQVFALRGRYGHGNGSVIPESAQYRLGGQDSLRGYRDDQFRGKSMFLGTLEYRFPVISKVRGALFTDFGSAWDSGWTPDGMHAGFGFGVLVDTPVGPIRVDLAHGSQGNRVHFSVGTSF